jgi:hypothetical protein
VVKTADLREKLASRRAPPLAGNKAERGSSRASFANYRKRSVDRAPPVWVAGGPGANLAEPDAPVAGSVDRAIEVTAGYNCRLFLDLCPGAPRADRRRGSRAAVSSGSRCASSERSRPGVVGFGAPSDFLDDGTLGRLLKVKADPDDARASTTRQYALKPGSTHLVCAPPRYQQLATSRRVDVIVSTSAPASRNLWLPHSSPNGAKKKNLQRRSQMRFCRLELTMRGEVRETRPDGISDKVTISTCIAIASFVYAPGFGVHTGSRRRQYL